MDDWQADVPEEALVSCLECRCQCTVVRAFVEIACRGVCVCVLVFIICTRQWENKWEGRPVGGCVQAPGKEREKRLRACVTYVFVHPCVRCFGDKRSAQKGFRCNVHLSVSVHGFFSSVFHCRCECARPGCQLLTTTSSKLSAAVADCSVNSGTSE